MGAAATTPASWLSAREIADQEPLAADRGHVVWIGRVGRDEEGVGKHVPVMGGQPDQVVAVGAEPVHEHDHLLRLAAGRRRHARAAQFGKLGHGTP